MLPRRQVNAIAAALSSLHTPQSSPSHPATLARVRSTGVDPATKRKLWRVMARIAAGGTSIILVSHSMVRFPRRRQTGYAGDCFWPHSQQP